MGLLKNLVKKVVGGAPAKPSTPATTTPPTSPRPSAPSSAAPRGGGTNAESDTPWYLDGQQDGWEDTNVDPAKKA